MTGLPEESEALLVAEAAISSRTFGGSLCGEGNGGGICIVTDLLQDFVVCSFSLRSGVCVVTLLPESESIG